MGNQKISGMANASAINGAEDVPVVQSGENRKATPNQIKTFLEDFFSPLSGLDVPDTTKTLDAVSKTYFYTGGGDGTWTMFPVASNINKRIEIKNMTAFNLTVQRAGSDNLYDVATTTSVIIGPGECWQIMCNGTYHVIMKS
jgi:hypothetical protein